MSSPIKLSKESFIKRHLITVKAGKDHPVNVFGRVFACTDASGPFEMCFGQEAWFPCRKGVEWGLVGTDRFSLLSFRATVDTTVEFYAGDFFWHENVVIPIIQHARTKLVPWQATSLAAASSQEFSAIPAGMSWRKSVIVTNNDASVDLEIYARDPANATIWYPCGIVFAKQAWYLETSDAIRVHNLSASPVNCRVLETFYLA
jgi:hypothetical protein